MLFQAMPLRLSHQLSDIFHIILVKTTIPSHTTTQTHPMIPTIPQVSFYHLSHELLYMRLSWLLPSPNQL